MLTNLILSPIDLETMVERLSVQITKSVLRAIQLEMHYQQPENPALLDIHEAAAFLKLTVPTIYSKVCRKELPVMKRSNRLYFSQSDLLEYLEGGRKKTSEELEKEAAAFLEKRKGGGHD